MGRLLCYGSTEIMPALYAAWEMNGQNIMAKMLLYRGRGQLYKGLNMSYFTKYVSDLFYYFIY